MIIYFFTLGLLFRLLSWTGLSTIVLAVTAWVIYQQVLEGRKSSSFLEYQIRPKAFPLLITAKERWPQNYGNSKKTIFAVINPDNFKCLFYVRITLMSDGRVLEICQSHWERSKRGFKGPLHVYPGGMLYPEVFGIEKLPEYEDKKIIAKIEYKIAPSNAPSEVFNDYQDEEWTFKKDEERMVWFWEGPNGIGPNVVNRLIDANRGKM